jgi:hypothetical protein
MGLCNEVASSWAEIAQFIAQSPLSTSQPTVGTDPVRALAPAESPESLKFLRAQARASARYVLRADIARFYPSIYTHSIPWALHGKATAKATMGHSALLGDRLDRLMRKGQDNQTVGIPIGPDTSLVVAEILLSVIDQGIVSSFPKVKGFRHIDDYELAFYAVSDAEAALHHIQSALGEFELALNPLKTRIIELPDPFDSAWAAELRQYLTITRDVAAEARGLVSYFDKAFQIARQHPEDAVLNYAVSLMRGFFVEGGNWPLLQSLLLQAVNTENGVLPFVLLEFSRYFQNGLLPDGTLLEEVLNQHIVRHRARGHDGEVAWALWGALAFQIPLGRESAQAVSQSLDSVVALLALDAHQRGLVGGGLNLAGWASKMVPEELYGEQWLLCYEANVKGWLPSVGAGDHVAADPAFAHLKALQVSFSEVSKATPDLDPTWIQTRAGAVYG